MHTAGQLVRSTKNNALFVYPTRDLIIDGMERYQIVKGGISVGTGLNNVLREKKGATIAWCGLSVKRQLFCDLVR